MRSFFLLISFYRYHYRSFKVQSVLFQDSPRIPHQQQQQQRKQWKDSVADNTSTTIIAVPLYHDGDSCSHDNVVKWRNGAVEKENFHGSLTNYRNSEPISTPPQSPQRTCLQRSSHSSRPDQRFIQRSTSMYYASSSEYSTEITSDNIPHNPGSINRSASVSSRERAIIPIQPKPPPRQIDRLKRTTITVDLPEVRKFSSLLKFISFD